MFFAFSVSPKQRVKKPLPPVPVEEIAELKLAPFAANPKIFFEDVKIGQSVTKRLLIKNPMSFTYKLIVTKVPPAERGVVVSWVATEVAAESDVLLELTWTPREEGSWRDILTVVDSRNVKRDVAVVFKTAVKKVAKKRTKGAAGVRAFKSPIKRFRSPKKKRSPMKAHTPPADNKRPFILDVDKENSPMGRAPLKPAECCSRDNTYTLTSVQLSTPRRKHTYTLHSPLTDRNVSFAEQLNGSGFVSPREASFRGDTIAGTPMRRDTYNVHGQPVVDCFNDSLEFARQVRDLSCDSPADGLLRKLQSESFAFTPQPRHAVTPTFQPTNCSTELKPSGESSNVSEHCSNPRALFQANNTYELSPYEHNLSTGTFSLGNLSSSTCILLSPEFKGDALASSPAAHTDPASNYLLNFGGGNARAALSCISEEDVEPPSAAAKRKCTQPVDTVFAVSPPKRAFIKPRSPVPRKRAPLRLSLNTGQPAKPTGTCDPFLAPTLLHDEHWRPDELKKWLNALLTPPSELNTAAESRRVDVARLWQECVQRELTFAPTKDAVSSSLYHTSNRRLDGLRKAAHALFHSAGVRTVLARVALAVDNKALAIRDARNLHLDVGLQSHVMSLLLCYNPLWLRLGLETVYGETIPLDSNGDVLGLSTFIVLRLFRDPQLAHSRYLPAYAAAVKRASLKRFLALVYFLDRAKADRLIAHDPCLFCRDAPVKQSRELLLAFARELLSAVGDVTKALRRLGYTVGHRQSYLDEFEYAVHSLGADLRDGVRLTRVMEILLERPELSGRLRAPAISRLQKVHNVGVAMDGLQAAGYTLAGDIRPKDIVDGHREKTLSLLWQIVYKFRAPRFTNAALRVQRWWRSLRVVLVRRIRAKPYLARVHAAIVIQRFYRGYRLMCEQRAAFVRLRRAAVTLQRYVRSLFLVRRDRLVFLVRRQAVLVVQQRYRAVLLRRRQQRDYRRLRQAVIAVQQRFRARVSMKREREYYLRLRQAALRIQERFRATVVMKQDRENYLQLRQAALRIQQRFRAMVAMKQKRESYLKLRQAALWIQQRFRAMVAMKQNRENYLKLRQAALRIQQWFRATVTMKQNREHFLKLRQAALRIQQWFRAIVAMKQNREHFLKLRQAALRIQQWFRATVTMKQNREHFLKLRQAALRIQQWFRATVAMKQKRESYLKLRQAALRIQQRFRANVAANRTREEYLRRRQAAITVQNWFRARQTMKLVRERYLQLRQAAVSVQQRFRRMLAVKRAQETYAKQTRSVVLIQQRFRARLAANQARNAYVQQRYAAVTIQHWFRRTRTMLQIRTAYRARRRAVVIIQQRFRAQLLMRQVRGDYLERRRAAIVIQQRFRATLTMKHTQNGFLGQRQAAIVIQQRFRATLIMKHTRNGFLGQRQAAIVIQQRFRATLTMKHTRNDFLRQRQAVIVIQQRFRASLTMKHTRNDFLRQRQAAAVLQQRFRANVAMKKTRQEYVQRRRAAVLLQRRFRANVAMKNTRLAFVNVRNGVVWAQRRFRAKLVAESQQRSLERTSAVCIQLFFRGYLCMKRQRTMWLQMRESAVVIQRSVRSYWAMKATRQAFVQTRVAVITVQRWRRAWMAGREHRAAFLLKRNKAVLIQRWFRAHLARRRAEDNNRRAAIVIQSWARMLQARRVLAGLRETALDTEETRQFRKTVSAVIKIQAVWRGYRARCLESAKLTRIRQRTIAANKRALPEHTAGERNREAIEILTYEHHTSMKDMIRALTVLDFTTRLLPQACISLRDKIVERLYLVLASTNRSVPDMDACVLSTSVLINLRKFAPTAAAVWKPHFLDTLLHMTLHWSSHEGLLFPYICTLLWLFAQDPDHSEAILSEENAGKILLKAYQECQRKQKMLSRIKNAPANTIQKQHIGAKTSAKKPVYMDDKASVPARSVCQTPALQPDWGILNSKHPRTFVSPTFAIKCLLKKLNVPVNQ